MHLSHCTTVYSQYVRLLVLSSIFNLEMYLQRLFLKAGVPYKQRKERMGQGTGTDVFMSM